MSEITYKLKQVKILILDVDGVLSDQKIIYNDNGSETKAFNVRDGLGLRLLMKAGIRVCIVTGRGSEALHHRCRNLGISEIYDNVSDKFAIVKNILEKSGCSREQAACMGDDLPDLPMMRYAGVSIAVADAHETIISMADMATSANGGNGAVREVCEAILKARGLWEDIVNSFARNR